MFAKRDHVVSSVLGHVHNRPTHSKSTKSTRPIRHYLCNGGGI